MSKPKIAQDFSDLYGHAPQVCAQAPGRVNLIGEHVDFSDGFVLPFAIKNCTYAAIRKRQDRTIKISSVQRRNKVFTISLDDVNPQRAGQWERYVLAVIWALGIDCGLEILIDGRVPIGAGLSSSAALECSVAVALNELFALNLSLEDLARQTQRAENEYVGMPCGIMDQSVSLMAIDGAALLLDCRDLTTRSISFDVASAGLELLIIDTQVHHALIDGGYAERRATCESVAAIFGVKALRDLSMETLNSRRDILTETQYQRAHHSISEISRVLEAVAALESQNFKLLGELLNQSHASLRDDYTVSCPELDCAVAAAISAGALGARMVGGGFGGSAIALIAAAQVEETERAIQNAFKLAGFKSPRFFTSLPSAGAQVIS